MVGLINKYNSLRVVLSLVMLLLISGLALLSCTTAAEPPPPPPPENSAPNIHYITAPTETLPLLSYEIDCVATDFDGDDLIYKWTTTGGTIIGNGASVVWNSPEVAGSYDLTVSVSDGRGGHDEMTTKMVVTEKPNASPVIIRMEVMNDDNTKIEVKPGDMTPVWVALWGTLRIYCIAEDPDGDSMDIIWSATEGRIEGEGNFVTYIASERGDFVVIANVIDSQGASTKSAVYIHVPCCGEGSFGHKGT